MRNERRKVIHYGVGFKRQIVSEFESGASIPELKRKYGVEGAVS